MGKITRRSVLWAIVFFWMIVIFCFSAQPAPESARLSGGITEFVVSSIVSNFDNLTRYEQHVITRDASFIIRKAAHMSIFAILGLFTMLAVNQTAKTVTLQKMQKKQTQSLIALGIGILYAISDELHQRFVPGRSCELRDVLIDVSGACVGIAIAWMVLHTRTDRIKHKTPAGHNKNIA